MIFLYFSIPFRKCVLWNLSTLYFILLGKDSSTSSKVNNPVQQILKLMQRLYNLCQTGN